MIQSMHNERKDRKRFPLNASQYSDYLTTRQLQTIPISSPSKPPRVSVGGEMDFLRIIL